MKSTSVLSRNPSPRIPGARGRSPRFRGTAGFPGRAWILAGILAWLTGLFARAAEGPATAPSPSPTSPPESPVVIDVKDASIEGNLANDKARLVIEATLGGWKGSPPAGLYATHVEQGVRVETDRVRYDIGVRVVALRGSLREIAWPLSGEGEVLEVTGEGLEDWSLRRSGAGGRDLVLRLKSGDAATTRFSGRIVAETRLNAWPVRVQALALAMDPPSLASGYLRLATASGIEVLAEDTMGLVPIEPRYLPDSLRSADEKDAPGVRAYRFHGEAYSLPLRIRSADPEAGEVVLSDFRLEGDLADETASFQLTARARVRNPRGGQLDLLSGSVALSEPAATGGWRLGFEPDRYRAVFPEAGEYPIRLRFQAGVRVTNGWSAVDFGVAPGTLAPMTLRGLGLETQVRLEDGARPRRNGTELLAYLPANGRVRLAWRPARPELEGRLFYAVEEVSQIAVSSGLLRQTTLLDLKVMQGELTRLELSLAGEGEMAWVQGPQILRWEMQEGAAAGTRRLVIQFNQPVRDRTAVQFQIQRSLGVFPLAFEPARLTPEGATRYGGHLRLVNEGAVRLEVLEAGGLSQISPDQFVQTEATRALLPGQATQVFAYRFAGSGRSLRVQADNILPELAVSGVMIHRLGETEVALDAEFEIDVREAPLRELNLRVPRGYSLARLEGAGVVDSLLGDVPAGDGEAELRIVYGAPVQGRQVVQLRLERNQPVSTNAAWTLPRIEVVKARSMRGHVGVVVDAGLRVSPARTAGLSELAPAFFPKKVAGMQAAYRIVEPDWAASMTVERLAQSIQVDGFHLFSVGEGVAYGSSLLNYVVSGAPVSLLQVELSGEYFNVEFTGKNIRNWQKTERGFQVQLHTPVAGAYALLVTYERPFKPGGETLVFTGARPVDAQTEQGYTLVVSAYQFEVRPVNVTGSLAALETGEVPAEYRLFFDAPILAAYRYASRPFNLELALRPLAQGEMVSQVIDRAALTTRVSEEGQVVTEARYFIKNKGAPNVRLRLPAGAELWSVTADGSPVVPVTDTQGSLLALPQRADPNVVTELQVKFASRAGRANRLSVAAPVVSAPILLAEWRLEPAAGQRLVYRGGTLTPAEGLLDVSGFAGLARLLHSPEGGRVLSGFGVVLVALIAGSWLWSSGGGGGRRLGFRHLGAGLIGLLAAVIALVSLLQIHAVAQDHLLTPARDLRFLAPIQQADATWSVDVANLAADTTAFTFFSVVLGVIAVALWVYAAFSDRRFIRGIGMAGAWTLLAWAALRSTNGAPAFVLVLVAFVVLQVLLPALRAWWLSAPAATSPAVALVAGLGLLLLGGAPGEAARAAEIASEARPTDPARPDVVDHEIRVEDDFVFGTARVRWIARTGEALALFREPGVLTRSGHPAAAARLVAVTRDGRRQHLLVAETNGVLEFPLEYQVRVTARSGERGFELPVAAGLVNRLRLTLGGLDVDVSAPTAVAVQREERDGTEARDTRVAVILMPSEDPWIGWRPRTRDARREKTEFVTFVNQLLIPGPGVLEGWHEVRVNPSQGELGELTLVVPRDSVITDVTSPVLSFWRFDPDTRRLRVSLSSPQSRQFTLQVRSQMTTRPLPFEQAAGVLAVEGSAGQMGLVGVASGAEVQVDDVRGEQVYGINLEDFPAAILAAATQQVRGLTLRRAFRHHQADGVALTVKASAVEPDVRVESQQTLSLGEDRIVLGATLDVEILRAGIFRLGFPLPEGLEVETVAGAALSHWTEVKSESARMVTLHLKGRTDGRQRFTVSLAGPGVRSVQGWSVPRLAVREAARQRGQLLIVPEQGLRLQVAARDGLTQIDPLQAGVPQKGVLAFRLLQDPWTLRLDLERVDAWVQVNGLQHVSFAESQVKVLANLEYDVENTGVKSLVVALPAAAENVRFRGDLVADYLARPPESGVFVRLWEVRLERRVLGRTWVQAAYTLPLAENATDLTIDGVEAREVNLQRGFVTVEASGRLQVRAEVPAALQATEWQVIPRNLQKDLTSSSASYAFRLAEPGFRLPVKLERREATRLLPARINSLTLNTVVSDDGATLTQVKMQMTPGDKRLLHLTLPERARFWFAFVNDNSVWPWQSTNQTLIPLEASSRRGEETTVEFFYGAVAGEGSRRSLELRLLAPRFDLPLEDITWRVHLNDKWRVTDWEGNLQLQGEQAGGPVVTLDLDTYIRNEAQIRQEKTREAEQFLNLANDLLQQGDPQQARRAFQAAFGLSRHDQAFNEDARVQLNNLKMQQALVGLNIRRARVAGETTALAATPRAVLENQAAVYSQSEAKQLLERNTAEENAIQQRLAERLIQQQEAAVANPAAIRATIPEQGRHLIFSRPLEVNTWSELKIDLRASATQAATGGWRLRALATVFLGLVLLAFLTRRRSPATSSQG